MTLPSDFPLVSIGVPAYNARRYIEQTIQSILSQNYPHIELLIQDNQSTDGTWELLEALAAQYPQISIEKNERNIGMVGNFSRVMNRARGEFLMVMGSDDILEPDFISLCVKFFDSDPSIDIVTSNYVFFESDTGKTWQKIIKLAPGSHNRFVCGVVIANNFSINFTLFRKNIIERLKINGSPFFTSFYTFDLELWLRVAIAGIKVYYLSQPLGKFRVHSNSTSKTQHMRMFKQIFLVLMMHKKDIKKHAHLCYRIKLLRFALRHIGHMISGQSQNPRLLTAILGELIG